MRRVVFNQKGGVGKSSITVNLAALSAQSGKKTLIIDLDSQCNAGQYLMGATLEDLEPTTADFFEQFLSFKLLLRKFDEFVHPTPYENLYIMPASPALGELQARLEAKHKIYKLKEALDVLCKGFDAVYIDTPPAFNFYTLSALIASDRCLIPFDCDRFSRRALDTLMENVSEIKADHHRKLEVEGIIVNQFMPRANLPARLVEELVEAGLPILKQKISSSVIMRESHDVNKPLIHHAPKHKLTGEFQALYDELNHD